MSKQPCIPSPLARSEACDIWTCSDCGTITLHVGAISLRLKPEHFRDMTETMLVALRELASPADNSEQLQPAPMTRH